MEKVRPWCGQPSDRGRLRNRTDYMLNICSDHTLRASQSEIVQITQRKVGAIIHVLYRRGRKVNVSIFTALLFKSFQDSRRHTHTALGDENSKV